MYQTLSFTALICALTTPLAMAEEKPGQTIEEVVVTANLSKIPLIDVLASATLIDKADIQALQPLSLGELLELQSGLDVVRDGGRASQTSLFTRGTNSDHTLILINGQRFNSATLGSTQFQFIDPEQIERIELVRGARSSIYGSDAIGGVLQIFTNTQPEKFSGYMTGETGSHNLKRFSAGISDSISRGYYSASLSREESDGIDNMRNDDGYNSDKDPYEIINGNLLMGYKFTDNTSLAISHFQNDSTADADSQYSPATSKPYAKNKQAVSAIDFDAAISESYRTQLALGLAIDHANQLDHVAETDGEFKTTRHSLNWLNEITIGNQLVALAGTEYIEETIDSDKNYTDSQGKIIDSRDNLAWFSQLQWQGDQFSMNGGLRADDNSAFGSKTTGSLSAGYKLDENKRFYMSWAEGFKAPTFNDLYYPQQGNPNLKPETSTSIDIGFKHYIDAVKYEFTAYQIDIENLIEWAPIAPDSFVWLPSNIAKAKMTGAEASAVWTINSWSINGSLSYVDARNTENESRLANRAKHKLAININKSFDIVSAGLVLKAQDERMSSSGNELAGHETIDIYLAADFSEQLMLKLKLNNVFDSSYQLNERYNEDGRSANAKLIYNF